MQGKNKKGTTCMQGGTSPQFVQLNGNLEGTLSCFIIHSRGHLPDVFRTRLLHGGDTIVSPVTTQITTELFD